MKYISILLILSLFLVACAQQSATTTNGALEVKTKILPNFESGKRSTFKVTVEGGTPPYQFSIAGSLPNGVVLGPDGTIGGDITLDPGSSAKTYPGFSLVVTDSKGTVVKQPLAITVVEPSISINTVEAHCIVNVKCDEPIATAEGGEEPYTFQSDTFAEGAPPLGMIVDVNGHILGTSKTTGTWNIGVCAKDLKGNSKCSHATVIVESGTWKGKYSESDDVADCSSRNEGTLTWTIKMDKDSFSGGVLDEGTTVSSNCEGTGSTYSFEGTVTGTISGTEISGVMDFSGSGTTSKFPFSGTITDDIISATYTGQDNHDGVIETFKGSFTLNKK